MRTADATLRTLRAYALKRFVCFQNFVCVEGEIAVQEPALRGAIFKIPDADGIPVTFARCGEGRFQFSVAATVEDYARVHEAALYFEGQSGVLYKIEDISSVAREQDPWFQLSDEIKSYLQSTRRTGAFLELGSRRRQDTRFVARNSIVPEKMDYVGFDIVDGPNVDVVGDAHQLGCHFEPNRFDVVYSDWVFEHLLMPWVAVVEINKVLATGGDLFINTNQSIGLHDMPWDFWRYSDNAWIGLLNEYTGFEIVKTALGEPVYLTPYFYHDGHTDHHGGTGFQASTVWARKVGPAQVEWKVDPAPLLARLEARYPKEIK